jgi:hypothetical protein
VCVKPAKAIDEVGARCSLTCTKDTMDCYLVRRSGVVSTGEDTPSKKMLEGHGEPHWPVPARESNKWVEPPLLLRPVSARSCALMAVPPGCRLGKSA